MRFSPQKSTRGVVALWVDISALKEVLKPWVSSGVFFRTFFSLLKRKCKHSRKSSLPPSFAFGKSHLPRQREARPFGQPPPFTQGGLWCGVLQGGLIATQKKMHPCGCIFFHRNSKRNRKIRLQGVPFTWMPWQPRGLRGKPSGSAHAPSRGRSQRPPAPSQFRGSPENRT